MTKISGLALHVVACALALTNIALAKDVYQVNTYAGLQCMGNPVAYKFEGGFDFADVDKRGQCVGWTYNPPQGVIADFDTSQIGWYAFKGLNTLSSDKEYAGHKVGTEKCNTDIPVIKASLSQLNECQDFSIPEDFYEKLATATGYDIWKIEAFGIGSSDFVKGTDMSFVMTCTGDCAENVAAIAKEEEELKQAANDSDIFALIKMHYSSPATAQLSEKQLRRVQVALQNALTRKSKGKTGRRLKLFIKLGVIKERRHLLSEGSVVLMVYVTPGEDEVPTDAGEIKELKGDLTSMCDDGLKKQFSGFGKELMEGFTWKCDDFNASSEADNSESDETYY